MLWFFERGADVATCEVRRRQSHFEIAIRRPGDGEAIDVATTPAELLERLEEVPRAMLEEGFRIRPVTMLSFG
jgi:hypothetical protein